MLQATLKMCDRCDQLTRQRGETMAVVVMDKDDGRKAYVVEESYIGTDEFEAFCGEAIYVSECTPEEDDDED